MYSTPRVPILTPPAYPTVPSYLTSQLSHFVIITRACCGFFLREHLQHFLSNSLLVYQQGRFTWQASLDHNTLRKWRRKTTLLKTLRATAPTAETWTSRTAPLVNLPDTQTDLSRHAVTPSRCNPVTLTSRISFFQTIVTATWTKRTPPTPRLMTIWRAIRRASALFTMEAWRRWVCLL